MVLANNPIYRWQTFGEHALVFNALDRAIVEALIAATSSAQEHVRQRWPSGAPCLFPAATVAPSLRPRPCHQTDPARLLI